MDYSGLTYTFINDANREGRSALPDAPVVHSARAGTTNRRLYAVRSWLAIGLHKAAWAIQPMPLALTGTSHGDLRHCEGARS